MEIGLLGPVELAGDGEPFELGSPRSRAVLAVLALQPNQVTPMERRHKQVIPELRELVDQSPLR